MSDIVRYTGVDDVMRLGDVLAKSGMFADARQGAQAVVKILAGREMGFGEIASMTGIHVINGRVSVGANLMASAVKKSGKYDYRVTENTEKVCAIEFFQRSYDNNKMESIGVSTFTLEDARKAGTKNMDKYARNMLFARAMSNGVRWFCPDALGGAPVYTPEEMGADTDEEGNVVQVVAYEQPAPQPHIIHERMPAEPVGRITGSQIAAIEVLTKEIWPNDYKAKIAEYVNRVFGCTFSQLTDIEAARMIEGLRRKLEEPEAEPVTP